MDEKKRDDIFIQVNGKASLLELKMKLLLSREENEVRRMSCSKVKNMMYNKYSKYLDEKDKNIIEQAIWVRNKMTHFEFSEILEKQQFIPSKVAQETFDHTDSNSIHQAIEKMMEGKSSFINENSCLYGQYLEFSSNPTRIQKLNSILDQAIHIVTRIVIESNKKTK